MIMITIDDFKPATYKLNLKHPELGEIGAWIEIKSSKTNEYLSKVMSLERMEPNPKKAENDTKDDNDETVEHDNNAEWKNNIRISAELAATLIHDWDEKFFKQPFDYDYAVELLQRMELMWIRDAINNAQNKNDIFFQKSLRNVKNASKPE